MSLITAICWLLLFTAKLVVAPPAAFPFHPACYDTSPPIVQQNVGNLTCRAKCLLGAANVQILFWPTEVDETSLGNPSTTVTPGASGIVSDGFTFVSPSVYIAYHELQALISCPTAGYIARGKSYDTTIAYAPEDVSASISARAHETCAFSEINYTKLANYPLSNATDFILSLPGALSLVDPAWSTCAPATYGAFDPPLTMQKASALTDPADVSKHSTPAAPGGYVGSAHGPGTMTSATTSSGSGTPLAGPRPIAPSTTDLQQPSPGKRVDPTAIKDSHDTAASESPLYKPPNVLSGESDIRYSDDPANTSSSPGKKAPEVGDHTENKQSAPFKTFTATATSKDPNDPSPILRLAGSTIASTSPKASSSNAILSASLLDPIPSGSATPVQKDHFTLPDIILVGPSGSSDEVNLGSHTVHIPDVPTTLTQSDIPAHPGPFAPNNIVHSIPMTATPSRQGPVVPSSNRTNIPMTVGGNNSQYSTSQARAGNASIAPAYTGGNERSDRGSLASVAVFLALSTIAVTAF